MRLWTRIKQWPLITFTGASLGVLVALAAAVLVQVEAFDEAPWAAFALAPLPAVMGMWLDWARLYRPTRRTRFWSFAFLFLGVFGGVEAGLLFREVGPAALGVASLVPLTGALVIFVGSRLMLFVSRRGRGLFGYGVVCGAVRRDESERVLVDAAEGLVELRRADCEELGERRLVDLSIGAPLAAIARVTPRVRAADPFRTEARSEARSILAVESSPSRLRRSVRGRARAWTAYLMVLALGASALGWGLSVRADDSVPPSERGCLLKWS